MFGALARWPWPVCCWSACRWHSMRRSPRAGWKLPQGYADHLHGLVAVA